MEKYSYPEIEEKTRCLECGDSIVQYRTNKKFCCTKCKNSYFNKKKKSDLQFKRKVDSQLARNYKILSMAILRGRCELGLDEITAMGFNVDYVTSFTKTRAYVSYACFDISYRISDSKIFKIKRLSLTLP